MITIVVYEVSLHLRAIPQSFKILTNFLLPKFHEFLELVVLVIAYAVEVHKLYGIPVKLCLQQ